MYWEKVFFLFQAVYFASMKWSSFNTLKFKQCFHIFDLVSFNNFQNWNSKLHFEKVHFVSKHFMLKVFKNIQIGYERFKLCYITSASKY